MKRTNLCMFLIMVVAFVMLESDLAIGQTPVFGPEVYLRETGKPQKITKDFSVQNPNEEFTLVVQNGEGKRGRVSSAIIELNGVQVVGPNEFNKQVDLIKKPVTVQSQNELEVEVRSQPGTSLNVTILGPETPIPSPVGGITVNPDGFPVNTPTQVTFTADIPYQPGGPMPTVVLEQVSQTGSVIGVEGTMVDDGQLSIGDEIEGDGIFSFRKTYDITQPGETWLRVKANVDGQLFYSDKFSLLAFKPLSDSEYQAITDTMKNGSELYWQTIETKSKQKALKDTIAYLKRLPIVKDAGISEVSGSIWIDYTLGLKGFILTTSPDSLEVTATTLSSLSLVKPTVNIAANSSGNNQVQNNKVLILSPFFWEFKKLTDMLAVKSLYENHNKVSGCPTYEIKYLQDDQAGVEAFKKIGDYGIVQISTHGNFDDKNGVTFLTGTTFNLQYLKDWYQGNLVPASPPKSITPYFAVTPKFFNKYVKSMPSSLIFATTCYATADESMSKVLLDKGAKTYVGPSDQEDITYGNNKAIHFHNKWIEDPQNLVTAGEVFNDMNSYTYPHVRCFQYTGEKGEKGETCWNLKGSTNLEAPTGDQLQDGGFESGTLGAWISQGDGRVIKRLGTFSPTEGSRMGIISTGLGYTTDSGAISQKVCIPPDVKKLKFDWNFNSEEFREYCGSIYQDFFRVDLINASGSTTNLFYRKVDDLCGDTFAVPFSFDQGDVWSTGWNSESIDISGFVSSNAGKAVTIKFSAGDVGDSIFDTGVLLDRIRISQ